MWRFSNPRLNQRELVALICMKKEFMVLFCSTREFSRITTCFSHLRKGRKWKDQNCNQQLFRSLGTVVFSSLFNLQISTVFSVGELHYSSSPFLFIRRITNLSITMIKSDRLVWIRSLEWSFCTLSLNLSLCFPFALFTSSSPFASLSVCFFSSWFLATNVVQFSRQLEDAMDRLSRNASSRKMMRCLLRECAV